MQVVEGVCSLRSQYTFAVKENMVSGYMKLTGLHVVQGCPLINIVLCIQPAYMYEPLCFYTLSLLAYSNMINDLGSLFVLCTLSEQYSFVFV